MNDSFNDDATVTPASCIPEAKTYVPDPYDWQERHNAIIKANAERKPRLILIGDSITHYWGGTPEHDIKRGADSWDAVFEPYNPVNMGFGMDRTQNVLWRLINGEIDGISPDVATLLIGVNNIFGGSTDAEIALGISKILDIIHERLSKTDILLIGLLPCKNAAPRITAINALISKNNGSRNGAVHFINPGRTIFIDSDGHLKTELFVDGLHPNEEGNRLLAASIKPMLDTLMKIKRT